MGRQGVSVNNGPLRELASKRSEPLLAFGAGRRPLPLPVSRALPARFDIGTVGDLFKFCAFVVLVGSGFIPLIPYFAKRVAAKAKEGSIASIFNENAARCNRISALATIQKNRSDAPEPLPEARPRAKRNSTWPPPLSGRGRYCFRLNPVNLSAHVWPVSVKQKPMHTHGSNCQRAALARHCSGGVLRGQGKKDAGIGTLPTHIIAHATPLKDGCPASPMPNS